MLSKEAIKSKKKFKRVGWLIKSIALNPTKLSRMKVAFQRMNYEFIVGKLPKKSPGATFTKLDLGGISTYKVSTPNSDPEKILLYFHGGAYIAGSPAAYYPMMSHLAKATGFTIYVPDYRLAPEHHFPSQLNDGLNTYNALIEELGYSANQIAFGGDSAGGNLALVTILKLKETGADFPSSVICLSPWADPAATGESYNDDTCAKDIVLGPIFAKVWKEYNTRTYLTYYVKDEEMDENNPFICPIKGDFSGCPPVMVHVGSDELLLSDSRLLIKAFESVNLEYEYKEWDGLWHVFQMESHMPEAKESFSDFSEFLNLHIGSKV
tara:strand:- start:78 stop:1046 length:969 start_codon:yes stop_codon:yes gene_type:complete